MFMKYVFYGIKSSSNIKKTYLGQENGCLKPKIGHVPRPSDGSNIDANNWGQK